MTKLPCGTTLRVYGMAFDARAFVRRHRIRTWSLWNRGEPPVPELPPLDHGGFTVRVSDATDTFEQMEDAARFLRKHRAKLAKVRAGRHVEELWLEVTFPMDAANAVTCLRVPRSVVNLAAELGITFVITAIPRNLAQLKK